MTISRRRFITISAAALGIGIPTHGATWRGVAMGADVSITLHTNHANADQILARAVARIQELENQFSIYQSHSNIAKLNETGNIINTRDFNSLLYDVDEIHRLTNGLFDPTIQPLWRAFADDANLPADAQKQTLLRVGWRHVDYKSNRVRFARAGMAMTLNGIAQGFITDQISALLTSYGFSDALVNIGEYRAGKRAAQIAMKNARDVVTLKNAALATSEPKALMLNSQTSHILHPKHGAIPNKWQSITVQAKRASIADGISTALCLAPDTTLAHTLINSGVIQRCILVNLNGEITTLVG